MAHLKYYQWERERLAHLNLGPCTFAEAEVATRKLCRHFKLPLKGIESTSGCRRSMFFWSGRIRYNVDYLNWLVVAHEVAHFMHRQRQTTQEYELSGHLRSIQGRIAIEGELTANETLTRIAKIRGQLAHGKHHAKQVDRAVKYIIGMGWNTGALVKVEAAPSTSLASEVSQIGEATPAVKEVPVVPDNRIERRQAQVARLERKIKALTTRLKRAKRSLGALERAKARREMAPVAVAA